MLLVDVLIFQVWEEELSEIDAVKIGASIDAALAREDGVVKIEDDFRVSGSLGIRIGCECGIGL